MIEYDDEQTECHYQQSQVEEDATAEVYRQCWLNQKKAADPEEGKDCTP